MPSEGAPRRSAANTKEISRGRRESAGSTRNISAGETSGAQPTERYQRYHWYCKDAGNRPPPRTPSNRGPGPSQRHSGGVEHQAWSRGEQRRANGLEQSVGPRHGRKTVSNLKPRGENQADSGMGPAGGTGRPPGSAPWPENIPNGRQPVWAVPGKAWLDVLPSAVEPMELGSTPEEVDEQMDVDPPPPEQTWDCRSVSMLSSIREHHQRRRSARPAPYSLLRLHPKQ